MIEVFRHPQDYNLCEDMYSKHDAPPGWYYWHLSPGCLPDTDPIGPFETEEEARKDANEQEDY
jgi:hypothetical protein